MNLVTYKSPAKMELALDITKGATPNSSGKDILKRYRELVAQRSADKSADKNDNSLKPVKELQQQKNLHSDMDAESNLKGGSKIQTKTKPNISIYEDDKENIDPNAPKSAMKKLIKSNLNIKPTPLRAKSLNSLNTRNDEANRKDSQKKISFQELSKAKEKLTALVSPVSENYSSIKDSVKGTPQKDSKTFDNNSKISENLTFEEHSLSSNDDELEANMDDCAQILDTFINSDDSTTESCGNEENFENRSVQFLSFIGSSDLSNSECENSPLAASNALSDSERSSSQNGSKSGKNHLVNNKAQTIFSTPNNKDRNILGNQINVSTFTDTSSLPDVEEESSHYDTELMFRDSSGLTSNECIGITPIPKRMINTSSVDSSFGVSFSQGTANSCTKVKELSVEDSAMYMNKITELSNALDLAEEKAKKESEKRIEYEQKINNFLSKTNQTHIQTTPGKSDESHSMSPSSKMLVDVALNASICDSPDLSKREKMALIEKTKTLVTEVRFADQACVELSEKNVAIRKDVRRLEETISILKKENNGLQDAVIRSAQQCAKAEDQRDDMSRQISLLKNDYDTKVQELQLSISQCRDKNKSLERDLRSCNDAKASLETNLAASQEKYEKLSSEFISSKETLAVMQERLTASKQNADVTIASNIASHREMMQNLQNQCLDLQKECGEREKEAIVEEKKRLATERERDDLQHVCTQLRKRVENYEALSKETDPGQFIRKYCTPIKSKSSKQEKTPTSTILARTLQSELARVHQESIRAVQAEHALKEKEKQLEEAYHTLEQSRFEIHSLHNKLTSANDEIQKLCRPRHLRGFPQSLDQHDFNSHQANVSNQGSDLNLTGVTDCSFVSKLGREIELSMQRLAQSKEECEKYRNETVALAKQNKELEDQLTYEMERSRFLEQDTKNKVQSAVQQSMRMFENVNVSVFQKLSLFSEKIDILNHVVNELQHNFSFIHDDESKSLNETLPIVHLDYSDEKERIETYRIQVDELNKYLEDCKQRHHNEINNLKQKLTNKEKDRNFENAIAHLKAQLERADQQIVQLTNEKEDLEQDSEDAVDLALENNELIFENEDLKGKIDHCERKISELTSQLEEKQSCLEECMNKFSELRDESNQLKIDLETQIEHTTNADKKLASAERRIEDGRHDITSLENKITELQLAYESTVSTLKNRENEKSALQVELQNKTMQFESDKKEASDIISRLKCDVEEKEKKAIELQKQRVYMEEQMENMLELKSNDERLLDDFRNSLERAENEIGDLKMSYSVCNEKLTSETESSNRKDKMIDEMNNDLHSLHQEIESQSQKYSHIVKELESVQKQMQVSLQKSECETSELREQLKHRNNQMQEKLSEKDKIISDMKKTQDAIIKSEMKERKTVNSKLENALNELNQMRIQMQSQVADLRNKEREVESVKMILESTIEEHKYAVEKEAKKFEEKTEILENKDKELKDTLTQLQSKCESYNILKRTNEEISNDL